MRWGLLKDAGLLSDVLTVFLRALFALQRQRARRQGPRGGQAGALSFIQFFGSALQVTPHFHSLVPDGVFVPREGGVRFEALPPPTQGEVERLLRVVHHRVLRLLDKRGALPAQGPEDALRAYQAHSLQQRLRWTEVDVRPPPSKQPRCAFLEGFSLHANTLLHANDRQGLERLCRYGARGALALERLSRAEDGRSAWRMKRPLPDGTTHLLFTGLELLRRVASLVPPPRANLTRFHGVFAPGAKLRPFLVPQATGAGEASVALEAAARKEPRKERTPRVDWAQLLRKTFDFDVLACVRCGGRPRVLAYLKEGSHQAPPVTPSREGGPGRRVPQGGSTQSAPAWLTARGLPSAAFLCLSAPPAALHIAPIPLMRLGRLGRQVQPQSLVLMKNFNPPEARGSVHCHLLVSA